MRLGDGVEWALHSCTMLALLPPDTAMPAARLAEFHGVPAAYLAKHLQALAQAGVVKSGAGRKGGYRLAKPARDITLLDIVVAVEGAGPAFRCAEIRRRGPAAMPPAAYRSTCTIAQAMHRAEAAWREQLAATSLEDIVLGLGVAVHPESARKAADWLQEVLR
jgi:Rrf2 family protein